MIKLLLEITKKFDFQKNFCYNIYVIFKKYIKNNSDDQSPIGNRDDLLFNMSGLADNPSREGERSRLTRLRYVSSTPSNVKNWLVLKRHLRL